MLKKKNIEGVKIDPAALKPYIRERKVKDPPRFPKVILGYEKEMLNMNDIQMNKMLIDLTKMMVDFKKKK